jgi:hypothetical protein
MLLPESEMEKTYATIGEAEEAYRRELEAAKHRQTLIWQRERDHQRRESDRLTLEKWERRRALLEGTVERAGSGGVTGRLGGTPTDDELLTATFSRRFGR